MALEVCIWKAYKREATCHFISIALVNFFLNLSQTPGCSKWACRLGTSYDPTIVKTSTAIILEVSSSILASWEEGPDHHESYNLIRRTIGVTVLKNVAKKDYYALKSSSHLNPISFFSKYRRAYLNVNITMTLKMVLAFNKLYLE